MATRQEIEVVMNKYKNHETTAEETNKALLDLGVLEFHLDPDKNVITEEEIASTVVSANPKMVSGYGFLDAGLGTLDKVKIENGVLCGDSDMGNMIAYVLIMDFVYKVEGNCLSDLVGVNA